MQPWEGSSIGRQEAEGLQNGGMVCLIWRCQAQEPGDIQGDVV